MTLAAFLSIPCTKPLVARLITRRLITVTITIILFANWRRRIRLTGSGPFAEKFCSSTIILGSKFDDYFIQFITYQFWTCVSRFICKTFDSFLTYIQRSSFTFIWNLLATTIRNIALIEVPHTNTIVILRVNKVIAGVLIFKFTTSLKWRTGTVTRVFCLIKTSIDSTILWGSCGAWCELNLYDWNTFVHSHSNEDH